MELSRLIARRLKAKADDLPVMVILGLAADGWRASGGTRVFPETAEERMRILQAGEVVFPRPEKGCGQPRRCKVMKTAGLQPSHSVRRTACLVQTGLIWP
jgi:hypothetical protein